MFTSSYRYKDEMHRLAYLTRFRKSVTRICETLSTELIAGIKFILLAWLISALMVVAVMAIPLMRMFDVQVMPQIIKYFAIAMKYICGLEISPPQSLPRFNPHRGSLLVANHISYLDAVVLGSVFNAYFVTSQEIGSSPLLGPITKAAGCLFVDRRNKMSLVRDLNRLELYLSRGKTVMFFPEGTTGSGNELLPLKSSLFEAARRTGAQVHVCSINYTHINGSPVSTTTRDQIAWYGDMTFLPHLWQLLKLKNVRVTIDYHGPVKPLSSADRKAIARQVKAKLSFQT